MKCLFCAGSLWALVCWLADTYRGESWRSFALFSDCKRWNRFVRRWLSGLWRMFATAAALEHCARTEPTCARLACQTRALRAILAPPADVRAAFARWGACLTQASPPRPARLARPASRAARTHLGAPRSCC